MHEWRANVKLLLDDRYAPITSSVGFFEAPIAAAGEAVHEWRISLGAQVKMAPLHEPFPRVLRRLEPLTLGVRQRELLLATESPWTAYFDNVAQGPDPFGPVSYLCEVLKCRGLIVSCVPNTISKEAQGGEGRYGGVQFQVLGPERTEFLNIVRSVSLTNDGGKWVFDAAGTIQPYEKPECYTARKIADRFTPEMLEEYCAALGVRYFDPSFYGSNGLLLEVREPVPPDLKVPRMTLAEAQRRLGIPV
jgi:hypothetical protein